MPRVGRLDLHKLGILPTNPVELLPSPPTNSADLCHRHGPERYASPHVGHLDRDAAVAFRVVADRIIELGCEAHVAAKVVGSASKRGVILDLGSPAECLKTMA